MRNDARPMGHDLPHDPVRDRPADARESVTHDRKSHIVNRDAEDDAKRDEPDEKKRV
jgi:hypothetical protein